MTARTTAAAGAWSSTATWVNGGTLGVPGNGDTLTLSHAVTLGDARTIGDSLASGAVTKTINISSGGSLTINTGGDLTLRGDLLVGGNGFTMNAGSILTFDASLAPSPAATNYKIIIPFKNIPSSPLVALNGTISSNITISSSTTNSAAPGSFDNNAQTQAGLLTADYVNFTRIGTASIAAFVMGLQNDSLSYFKNCIFDTCGEINHTSLGGDAQWTVQKCTFKNSVGANNFTGSGYGLKSGIGVRFWDDNVFDKTVNWLAPNGLTIQNCFIDERYVVSNDDKGGWDVLQNCFMQDNTEASPFSCAGKVKDCFIYKYGNLTNPHFLQLGSYAGTPAKDFTAEGVIFEADNTSGAGDCVVFASVSSTTGTMTCVVKKCIVLPNTAGENSGTIFSALGGLAGWGPGGTVSGIYFSAINNTYIMGTQGAAIAETYVGHAGMMTLFAGNLAWDTSARGYKLYRSGTSMTTDYVTAGNVKNNGGFNFLTGSNGNGYNNLAFSSGTPGTGDVTGDPLFVDATRDLAKWAGSLGATGTDAQKRDAAVAELKKRNDRSGYNSAYNIPALMAYIRVGFAPQETAYKNADHVGGDIGAVAVVTALAGQVAGLSLLGVGF